MALADDQMMQAAPGSCLNTLLFLIIGALIVLLLLSQQVSNANSTFNITATAIFAANNQFETAIAATTTAQSSPITATP